MAIAGRENGGAQAGLGVAHERAHKHPFGLLCGGAVALAGAAKAAGISDIGPVCRSVDGGVEVARIDKGLEQPQGVAEVGRANRAPIGVRSATVRARRDCDDGARAR